MRAFNFFWHVYSFRITSIQSLKLGYRVSQCCLNINHFCEWLQPFLLELQLHVHEVLSKTTEVCKNYYICVIWFCQALTTDTICLKCYMGKNIKMAGTSLKAMSRQAVPWISQVQVVWWDELKGEKRGQSHRIKYRRTKWKWTYQ